MKKLVALSMALTMAVGLLAGCGGNTANNTEAEPANSQTAIATEGGEEDGGSEATAPSGDSIVRVGISSDPADLSPFTAMSDGGNAFKRTVYEYLIDRESFGGEMKGVIMKDYEQVDDVTYRMEIYDYIYDTEGNHLTASDVKWSIDAAKDAGNLSKLTAIESVEVIDEYVVEFTFTALSAGDLEALWSESPIITQAAFEASPDGMSTTPVGTTAYKVTEYVSGSSLTVERTGNYWQTEESLRSANGMDNVDTIVFQVITENSQMSIALETGTIDISTSVSDNDVVRFEEGGSNADGFTVYKLLSNRANSMLFNCDPSSPMSDINLRLAVAYAIDRDALGASVYNGQAEGVYTFGNSKYSDYNTAWESDYFTYDPELAAEYLAESSYTGETLKLMLESSAEREAMAQIIQGFLSQIGISTEILVYDNALFNTYTYDASQYDLVMNTQGSTDYLVNLWKLPFDANAYDGVTNNFVNDDEWQALLVAARTNHSQEDVDAFHYHMKDNAYATGLTNFYSNIVHANFITDIFTDARGYVVPGACGYSFK